MNFDKNKYLEQVLETHKMKHVETLISKYKKKRDEVKDAIEEKFSDKKVTRAINSGSYAKHTAINKKFDIDICQPFKYNSFSTLKEMADALYDYFSFEYEDEELIKYKIRKQRVSTGLTFLINGDEIQMDIVPGRELSEEDYLHTHRLNLYVRSKGLDPASSTQTSIQKHVDLISGKQDERSIIRLLKIWKVHNNKDIKSFFLELIIIRAFESASEIPQNLWDKLEMAMQFIRDNVKSIRLEDPANSNNIVSDTLTIHEKEMLSNDMGTMLDSIEGNDKNLEVYFPANEDFNSEKESKKAAALEVARTGVISKPWVKF